RELQAPQFLLQLRLGGRRRARREPQPACRQPVRRFRRKQEQQPPQRAIHAAHTSRVGYACAMESAAPLPGTQDLLFEAAKRLRRCEEALRAVFEKAGYAEVIPPT